MKRLEALKFGSLAVPSKDVVIRDFWTQRFQSVNVEIIVVELQMRKGTSEVTSQPLL